MGVEIPLLARSYGPNPNALVYTKCAVLIFDVSIRCREIGGQRLNLSEFMRTVDLRWVGVRHQNFFVGEPNFT